MTMPAWCSAISALFNLNPSLALLVSALWLPLSAEAQHAPHQASAMARCEAKADADRSAGAERRRYLAECFAAKRKPQPLQAQFSGCEAQARRKNLRGSELRSFMEDCMKA